MSEQSDPINETTEDATVAAPAAATLDAAEQRGNGFLIAFTIPADTTGAAVEMDAAALGVLPGHLVSVTPANPTSAALLPYAHVDEASHTVAFGTGAPSTNGALVTVMVTR
ncbi:hypothetical protein ACGF12_35795 [Kitasatospora sp. NPDC048296]|uniref:hypothetical protein n=1 Tax=Kitasatospora sp. NPDC048296 TaxID=3364048 RepID=UPI003717BC2B